MPRSPYANLFERLIANTAEPINDRSCWLWCSHKDRWGYGRFNLWVDGRSVKLMAHIAVWVWTEAKPETPEEFYSAYLMLTASGLELDHLCVTPNCCNPDHLEVVTSMQNSQRRDSRANMTYRLWT